MIYYLLNTMFDAKVMDVVAFFQTINAQLTCVTYPHNTVDSSCTRIVYTTFFFPYFKSHKNLLIN